LIAAGAALRGQQTGEYTLLVADVSRPLPYTTAGGADMVSLDQLANIFGFTYTEDTVVRGLTVDARGRRILLVPGFSGARVNGQLVSLSASVTREGNSWQVPIDFLSNALGPALGTRIEVRRTARLVLVGDVRVPEVRSAFERLQRGGRVVLDVVPATAHEVTREGNRIVVRFDAAAVQAPGAIVGALPDLVNPTLGVEGTMLVIDLGPSVETVSIEANSDARIVIALLPPAPAATEPAAPPPPVVAPEAPRAPLTPTGTIQTIVVDPGHGGEETGAVGLTGTLEKDVTLQAARRLKAAIESRLGLRVLLTREGDDTIPVDRRSALANNNKADLFISLHANAAPVAGVSGARVFSLNLDDYRARVPAPDAEASQVQVWDGSTRSIDILPWDLAQLPYAGRSSTLARILVRQLRGAGVTVDEAEALPLRALVGTNMPAVLIEMGFLSNPADERALASGTRADAVVVTVLNTIAEIRRGVPADSPGGAGAGAE